MSFFEDHLQRSGNNLSYTFIPGGADIDVIPIAAGVASEELLIDFPIVRALRSRSLSLHGVRDADAQLIAMMVFVRLMARIGTPSNV